MSDARTDINTMIRQLTEPVRHTERITQPAPNNDGTHTQITRTHTTTAPALLDQLANAHEQSATTENGQRPGFTSKPPARIEAIDAYIRIDLAAARWVRDLGEDDPGDTKACVRKLNGLLASAHHCGKKPELKNGPACCTVHAAERDIRHWWTTARVFSGWDKPPFCPSKNTCPLCGEKGTLRIRILDLDDELATGSCTACHESWPPDHIGLLADHIREENQDAREEAPA